MAYAGYKQRANGQFFENLISASCREYQRKGVAYIQKTPEPMRPIKAVNRNNGQYLAVFEKKAQPDFTGTLKGGQSVMFEAKHTEQARIEFNRISNQQEYDLKAHHELGAISFILLSFKAKDFYRVTYEQWEQLKITTGKKSANQKDLESYRIILKGLTIPFLEGFKGESVDFERNN